MKKLLSVILSVVLATGLFSVSVFAEETDPEAVSIEAEQQVEQPVKNEDVQNLYSNTLSRHALGMAIDINTQQNPYVWYENGVQTVYHSNARAYIDRTWGDPHMIIKGDIFWYIFSKYGFNWGGDWLNPIDYQHFEK